MVTKIEQALLKLGVEEDKLPIILESIPQIVMDFEHNYSMIDLKIIMETLIYIHISQNIRNEGMWIKEKNCPNNDRFPVMSSLKLIDTNLWRGLSVKTTADGERLSKAIMETKIEHIDLNEMFKSMPQIIIKIIQNNYKLPSIYPNKSYLKEGIPQNFISSLPSYNITVYTMCKSFYLEAIKEGWARLTHDYVSTNRGKEGDEYYILSDELMNVIKDFNAEDIPNEVKQQINNIIDKLKALKFINDYYDASYNGLGNYSNIEQNILSYLIEIKDLIDTSKDLFETGFTSQTPYRIRDVDGYKTQIIKFERELNEQLMELFSGMNITSQKRQERKTVSPQSIIQGQDEKRKTKLQQAKNLENACRYEDAAKIYEELDMWTDAGRVRKLAKQEAVPVTKVDIGTVIGKQANGDIIENGGTNIKDSAIARSQIGGGCAKEEKENKQRFCNICDNPISKENISLICEECDSKFCQLCEHSFRRGIARKPGDAVLCKKCYKVYFKKCEEELVKIEATAAKEEEERQIKSNTCSQCGRTVPKGIVKCICGTYTQNPRGTGPTMVKYDPIEGYECPSCHKRFNVEDPRRPLVTRCPNCCTLMRLT